MRSEEVGGESGGSGEAQGANSCGSGVREGGIIGFEKPMNFCGSSFNHKIEHKKGFITERS